VKHENKSKADVSLDPVASIEGLLKNTKKTSVELQHEAVALRVKKALGGKTVLEKKPSDISKLRIRRGKKVDWRDVEGAVNEAGDRLDHASSH
jgi:hypothetical protein